MALSWNMAMSLNVLSRMGAVQTFTVGWPAPITRANFIPLLSVTTMANAFMVTLSIFTPVLRCILFFRGEYRLDSQCISNSCDSKFESIPLSDNERFP